MRTTSDIHRAATDWPSGALGVLQSLTELTVIVPTRNEAGNITILIEQLRRALHDSSAEVLVVDDSDDDTPAAVRQAAAKPGLPVRLLHRTGTDRIGGLGGAVLAGLRASSSPWVVVMDGDLQHPAELVPQLFAAGRDGDVDLVVASRHTGGGDAGGLAGPARQLVSGAATALTRALFPRALRDVSDPMSGFFAIRRAALDLDDLRPCGFKILLELIVRSGQLRAAEVPFSFGERGSGDSKATLAEGRRFLQQLLHLRFSARTVRAIGFAAVGLTGLVVNLGLVWFLAGLAGMHFVLAATLATQVSSLWNAVLAEVLVYRRSGARTGRGRVLRSVLLNNGVLLVRLPALILLVSQLGVDPVWANAITLLLAFTFRFHISDRHIYAPGGNGMTATETNPIGTPRREPIEIVIDRAPVHASTPKLSRYLPHRYDIAGVLTVGSEVPLRELEWFRSSEVGRNLDIEIRVGSIGGAPRRHTRLTQHSVAHQVAYEEHLGRLGANFHVDMADNIKITAGPLLARSPHVLYTNVVEAMLRFVMVSRGRMLLHSACLDFGGRGLLMSARTDTGKTGTVLRMLREQGAKFLSDDMTILSPDGSAHCFPKPLTISQHTLRAIEVHELSKAEWRRLRLQSRLHSKEGRAFGTMLAEHNLPIMGVNALTQIAIPPPKYFVQRLVDCDVVASTQIQDLFIIERGEPKLEWLDAEQTVAELIENTDDAYGFPPFRWFAPAVVLGDDDYVALRAKEEQLLRQALRGVPAHRLASDSFSWADDIPVVLAARGRGIAAETAAADLATATELRKWVSSQRRADATFEEGLASVPAPSLVTR